MGDYTRLAALIGTHQELAIFRQFAAMRTKNLLYMQAELVHLEAELENIVREDRQESFKGSLCNLKESSGTENDVQWRKVLEIRNKLKEYGA